MSSAKARVTWQWAKSSQQEWILGHRHQRMPTSKAYTPVVGDNGNYLRATASYTDGHGSGKTEEAATDGAVSAASANSAPEFPATEDGARSVARRTRPPVRNIGDPVAATRRRRRRHPDLQSRRARRGLVRHRRQRPDHGRSRDDNARRRGNPGPPTWSPSRPVTVWPATPST